MFYIIFTLPLNILHELSFSHVFWGVEDGCLVATNWLAISVINLLTLEKKAHWVPGNRTYDLEHRNIYSDHSATGFLICLYFM